MGKEVKADYKDKAISCVERYLIQTHIHILFLKAQHNLTTETAYLNGKFYHFSRQRSVLLAPSLIKHAINC